MNSMVAKSKHYHWSIVYAVCLCVIWFAEPLPAQVQQTFPFPAATAAAEASPSSTDTKAWSELLATYVDLLLKATLQNEAIDRNPELASVYQDRHRLNKAVAHIETLLGYSWMLDLKADDNQFSSSLQRFSTNLMQHLETNRYKSTIAVANHPALLQHAILRILLSASIESVLRAIVVAKTVPSDIEHQLESPETGEISLSDYREQLWTYARIADELLTPLRQLNHDVTRLDWQAVAATSDNLMPPNLHWRTNSMARSQFNPRGLTADAVGFLRVQPQRLQWTQNALKTVRTSIAPYVGTLNPQRPWHEWEPSMAVVLPSSRNGQIDWRSMQVPMHQVGLYSSLQRITQQLHDIEPGIPAHNLAATLRGFSPMPILGR